MCPSRRAQSNCTVRRLHRFVVSSAALGRLFAIAVAISASHATAYADDDPVKPFQAAIADVREHFWKSGALGASLNASLAPIEAGLQALANRSTGGLRARALLELGRTQRMDNAYAASILTLTECAKLADAAALPDVAFDAWLNIARAYVIGIHDYGAASDAIDHADTLAGDHPSQKQQLDLADMRAILFELRGEPEASLVEAVAAARLAQTPEDRYFGTRDTADALYKIFYRCQQMGLIDSESQNDSDIRWGACKRVMAATRAMLERAGSIAEQSGWSYLAQQAREEVASVGLLYGMWQQNDERFQSRLVKQGIFHPKSASAVLASQWWGNATIADIPEAKAFAPAINDALAQARLLGSRQDAQSLSLMAARPGTDPNEFARLLAQASEVLQSERHSFFDARRRGTVMEASTDIPRSLALQYLSLHKEAEAFDAFESMRARGLGELSQALDGTDTTDATRQWLASVLLLDAQSSRIETQLVEKVSATGDASLAYGSSEALQRVRLQRERLIKQGRGEIERLGSIKDRPAHLAELESAARASGIPVMLYWSDSTALIVWYVGPHGSEVRNVFLPAAVLQDDVRRIYKSASEDPSSFGVPFDDTIARELYLFLIAPFEHLLDAKQIMIVPEGPLMDLPFETLLMPGSDKPMIERWAISYSPNATLALRALQRPPGSPGSINAIIDPDIDGRTHESAGLHAALGSRLNKISFDSLTAPGAASTSGGRSGLHLLLHGKFDPIEPLMSELSNEARSRSITAAEFVGLPLGDVRLAVLSGCETGQVGIRLSNEIYGFPWALLAGGVDAAVVSRWQVQGTSNQSWMRLFYSAVMSGELPAQAGAVAMRGLRAEGQTHPFYWAAMQVTGR